MARLSPHRGAQQHVLFPPLEGVLSPTEFGRLGAFLLGSAGLLGAVGVAILAMAPAREWPAHGYHPVAVGALCCVVLLGAVGVVRWADHIYPRWAGLLVAVATALVTLIGLSVGGHQSPFATIFYVWVGISFVLLPNRVAVIEVLLVGAFHAMLLAVQPDHEAVLAEWVFTFGVTAITAWVVKRVVEALVEIARGERAARTEAERGNAALEDLSRRETAFLGRMSHEVRNPLNAILGYADMLGDGLAGPLNEQQADYVAEVRSSGRHLLDLIGDVFDVGRVAEGREDLVIAEISVESVVVRAANLFRNEAERRGVHLEVTAEPIRLLGDERKIRQVLLNLLSNAVKFTPPGGRVDLSATLVGDAASIQVADSGAGISADDVDRIFEEYRQAPGGAALGAGTGLGLPLARRFATQHGGTLTVASAVGQGSTFTLRLPLRGPCTTAQSATPRVDPVDEVPSSRWRRPLEHPELRGRLAPLAPLLGVGAIVLGCVTLAIHLVEPVAAYRPAPLVIIAIGAMCVVGPLLVRARTLTVGAMSALLFAATIVFTLSSYFVGPVEQPYGTTLYVWIAIAAVCFLSRRQVVVQVAVVALAYGVLLGAQGGNTAPAVRWLIVVGVVAVSSLCIDTLVARLGALADAEREARVRLEGIRAELEGASRHKTRFLATMSHELRTPLNAIMGFSDVLADELFGPLTDIQREYVSDLTEAGRELLALVNDILDLAKLDAGRMDLDVVEGVDVAEALRIASAGQRPVPVQLEIDGAVASVALDLRKFCRIVANLIDEEAATDGCRLITVSAGVGGGWLIVEVVHVGPFRGRSSPRLPGGREAPLRVGVAAALAELHGGAVDPLGSGWRLSLPTPIDVGGSDSNRERV